MMILPLVASAFGVVYGVLGAQVIAAQAVGAFAVPLRLAG